MNDLGLGKIITGDAQKDAIHVAVAPVIAHELLSPGQHVGIFKERASMKASTKVGIVDPFLDRTVEEGERFWLFLYPNTVVGLRHEWYHPAFAERQSKPLADAGAIAFARQKIEDIAEACDISYTRLMAAAERWNNDTSEWGDYLHMGDNENYKDGFTDEFWDHYEVVTGAKATKRGSFFSCSC